MKKFKIKEFVNPKGNNVEALNEFLSGIDAENVIDITPAYTKEGHSVFSVTYLSK